MTNTLETVQGIEHYRFALEEVKRGYISEDKKLTPEDKEKIKNLISGYESFKNNPQYNPYLAGAIRKFVLGERE